MTIQIRYSIKQKSRRLSSTGFLVVVIKLLYEEWKQSGGATGFYKSGENCSDETDGVIRGVAGSSGQTEGIVRVMNSVDEADEFKKCEILVVKAANIGFFFFPLSLLTNLIKRV